MIRLVVKTHPSGIQTTALSAINKVLVGLLLVAGIGSPPTIASATEIATGVMLGRVLIPTASICAWAAVGNKPTLAGYIGPKRADV